MTQPMSRRSSVARCRMRSNGRSDLPWWNGCHGARSWRPPGRCSPRGWRSSMASPATRPAAATMHGARKAPVSARSMMSASPARCCSPKGWSSRFSSSTSTCTRATAPPTSLPATRGSSHSRCTASAIFRCARSLPASTSRCPTDRRRRLSRASAGRAAGARTPRQAGHRLLQCRRRPACKRPARPAGAQRRGLRERDRTVLGYFRERDIPLCGVIGGGYSTDLAALAGRHAILFETAAELACYPRR